MGLTGKLFQTVTDVDTENELLKTRAYGVIEVCDQEFRAIHLRPYPKLVSMFEARWADFWKKRRDGPTCADRILLYYNQPMLHRNFLALKYFVSDSKSSLATIAISLSVLDYVAKVKHTDAIVTEITNERIRDRHLAHFGWEQHLLTSPRRNWIKRYYGEYPATFLFKELQQQPAIQSIRREPVSTEALPC